MKQSVPALAAAATVLLIVACARSPERERVDFERMRLQQRYDLYGTSAAFANRASMQHPPAGTLSRESAADSGALGSGESAGHALIAMPIAMTAARLARGRDRFGVYCAVCHGAGAFGGSVVAEDMGPPRPPSLRSPVALAWPPGLIFGVITRGFGRMPSYAVELTPEERWDVVGYLEQLRRSPVTTVAERSDSLRAVAIQRMDSTLAAEQRTARQ